VNKSKKGKVLAIDFGEKHVGLAVSDDGGMIAFGRGTVSNYGSLDNLFSKIGEMCDLEGVSVLIMGLPKGPEEEHTVQSKRIEEIGHLLSDYLNLPVKFVDESFSSYEAGEKLKGMGVKAPKTKEREDEMAATMMLQKYLDESV
jgi:putative Holliday junction resolvase